MSDQPGVSPETQPLQFETAEPVGASPAATAAALPCANCKQPMAGEYFEIAGQTICTNCRQAVGAVLAVAASKERFVLAAVYGAAAAVAGGFVWWAVRAATGYEIGLVAVAVGFLVGYAVRAGSQGRGGRRFQILALVLTYLGITLNYVPDVIKGLAAHDRAKSESAAAGDAPAVDGQAAAGTGALSKPDDSSGAHKKNQVGVLDLMLLFAVVIGIAASAPFLGGASNIIGIFIIGFALWEAWKMNRSRVVTINGPFRINAASADLAPPAVPSGS
ncbi:MAG TPA: hypothetical protein VGL59_14200 [Polyangia bacterium]|jgi:hypothetical protein